MVMLNHVVCKGMSAMAKIQAGPAEAQILQLYMLRHVFIFNRIFWSQTMFNSEATQTRRKDQWESRAK